MLAALQRVLTSRIAGPVASALALVLAIALAASWAGWDARRAALEARIGQLEQQAGRSQALWKAQLAACHAAAVRPQDEVREVAGGDPETAARRLLSQQPEGIDVCARMESADQAVLSTLK